MFSFIKNLFKPKPKEDTPVIPVSIEPKPLIPVSIDPKPLIPVEPVRPTGPLILRKTLRYDDALKELLKYEGGKDDDKYDPGGRTAFGVTQREFNKFLKDRGLPTRDVWTITRPEIADFYRVAFWNRLRCDLYHPAIAFVLFDFGVNAGTLQAVKDAQRVLGVRDDGILGPQTVGALTTFDPDKFVTGYAKRREIFYRKLPTFWRFGKGWLNRVSDATDFAKKYI